MTEKQLKSLRIRLQIIALQLEQSENQNGKIKVIEEPLMINIDNWLRDLKNAVKR